MSDDPQSPVWAEGDPGVRESIGAYLASQRRLRGISLDELALRTRIPRRNLERLEAGAFDDQPDGFVRGFVRTVAAELGLDAQEAVMRLIGEPAGGEDEWRRRRRMGLLAGLALAGGCAVLVLGWALRETARWVASPAEGVEGEHVYRRDAVRALLEAESSGAREPRASVPGGPGPDGR